MNCSCQCYGHVFILENCLKYAMLNWTSTMSKVYACLCEHVSDVRLFLSHSPFLSCLLFCKNSNEFVCMAEKTNKQFLFCHAQRQIQMFIFQLWYSNWHETYQLITHWHALVQRLRLRANTSTNIRRQIFQNIQRKKYDREWAHSFCNLLSLLQLNRCTSFMRWAKPATFDRVETF